ncbi:hypothetical protein SDC9_202426 [bioreactor metagenome]|uniref:Uncharacterized protein n=1 Tax=bioreactor metagenome TaxID=1076179 RepID=A0A645IWE8_9ZZZZ
MNAIACLLHHFVTLFDKNYFFVFKCDRKVTGILYNLIQKILIKAFNPIRGAEIEEKNA